MAAEETLTEPWSGHIYFMKLKVKEEKINKQRSWELQFKGLTALLKVNMWYTFESSSFMTLPLRIYMQLISSVYVHA